MLFTFKLKNIMFLLNEGKLNEKEKKENNDRNRIHHFLIVLFHFQYLISAYAIINMKQNKRTNEENNLINRKKKFKNA